MQEEATYQTNRIDLFCRKWLGSDTDETRRQFIQWNFDWFRHSPTFWLQIGRLYWIEPPKDDGALTLAIQGDTLVLPRNKTLGLPPQV